jgi:hypothetical protein
MRSWAPAAALVAVIVSVTPTAAQQAVSAPRFSLSYPTIIYDPLLLAKGVDDTLSGCSPGLQCRVRLLGVIQKYGAVELRATAFTW